MKFNQTSPTSFTWTHKGYTGTIEKRSGEWKFNTDGADYVNGQFVNGSCEKLENCGNYLAEVIDTPNPKDT